MRVRPAHDRYPGVEDSRAYQDAGKPRHVRPCALVDVHPVQLPQEQVPRDGQEHDGPGHQKRGSTRQEEARQESRHDAHSQGR